MKWKSSSERMAEAVARAHRHWQTQHRAETEAAQVSPAAGPPPLTIALSREVGANGSLAARAVGERLGWPVYDRELLQKIADEMGLHSSLLESVDERRGSWLREALGSLASQPGISGATYVRRLVEVLLSLAAHGGCVIVGRGAAQILPAATTLRVRLVAPLRDRIEVISQRLSIGREEAARWIDTAERERSRFVQDHFQKNPDDPRQYDLVLNSARFTVPECAELIVEALRRMQARVSVEQHATAGV